MGNIYMLVNISQHDTLEYYYLHAYKQRELVFTPIPACLTTYYVFTHPGDLITTLIDERFFTYAQTADAAYRESTVALVEQMLHAGLLTDQGINPVDADDPEREQHPLYARRLGIGGIDWGYNRDDLEARHHATTVVPLPAPHAIGLAGRYVLVNTTRQTYLAYRNLPQATRRDLIINPITACMTAYFLFFQPHDVITALSAAALAHVLHGAAYTEVTDHTIVQMLDYGFLRQEGGAAAKQNGHPPLRLDYSTITMNDIVWRYR